MPTLMPSFSRIVRGELLWNDLRYEQRVFVIRSGIFACIANLEHEIEVPFALMGPATTFGMAELFISRATLDTYYSRALTQSMVCSFPAKPVRKHLEALPNEQALSIVASACTNSSVASYAQTKLLAKPLVSDRLMNLLATICQLSERGGQQRDVVHLTHDELASLVSSDRASVTRSLHRLADAGLVTLGYKCVGVTEAFREHIEQEADGLTPFHVPEQDV
ncbi:MAG: Crp/Fnr family transcriptional regulator [Coriobacteriales bacterium]|jgi:CRP-like cAMP-binding protein